MKGRKGGNRGKGGMVGKVLEGDMYCIDRKREGRRKGSKEISMWMGIGGGGV